MRFKNIEISGIENIVFNRKTLWRFVGESWWEKDDLSLLRYSHEQMMGIVNSLKRDQRYRMWCHMDTLNIVRKNI